MKSLSSMSAGSGQSKSSNRGQVIRSCLPIVGTALLIAFLGGFPPTTWVLLFQTFGELNLLLRYNGPGMIMPLVILIVQSLLLAVAWVLLGWVVLREGAYLMTMQSKAELDRLLAFQSASGELINPAQVVTKQLQAEPDFAVSSLGDETMDAFEEEQDYDETMDAFEEEQDYDEAMDAFEEEQDYGMTTAPLEQEQDYGVTTAPLRRGREFDVTTAPLRRGREFDVTTAPLRRGREFDVTTAPLRRGREFDVTTAPLRRGREFDAAMVPLGMATGQLGVTTSPLREEVPEEEVSWGTRSVQSRSRQLPSGPSQNMQLLSAPSRPSTQSRGVHASGMLQQSSTQSRNVQQSSTQSRNVQQSSTQSRNVQQSSTQSRNVQQSSTQSRNVQQSSTQSRNVQQSSTQSRGAQSRDVQPRNVQSSSAQLRHTSSLRRGSSTGRRRGVEDALENPFDKELPIPEEDNVKPDRARMVTKKEEPPEEENEEDDNPFVYGNPFDGPLPEVFRYDTELRRTVMEMTEEEASQSNGSKAKGNK